MQAPVASVRVSCKLWRLYPWTVAFHKLSEWHLLVRCIQHKMLAVCFSRCHWSPLYFWWYRLQEVRSNHKQSGCKRVQWEVHLRRQWSTEYCSIRSWARMLTVCHLAIKLLAWHHPKQDTHMVVMGCVMHSLASWSCNQQRSSKYKKW